MALDVRVDCDEKCFGLPEWPALLARDPNRHVFATPEWNRLWWEQFGAGKDLFMLTMYRGPELVAIAPLYRKLEDGRKILRFNGGIDLTDYLGPICSLEDRDEVAEALVRWLDTTDIEWDEFDAHNMPVPLGFAEFLVDHSDRHGFEFRLDQEETTAVLPLVDNWETYVEHLDKKERHELRRKRRRLGRDHPDAKFRTATAQSLDEDLNSFIEMHKQAEGHKGRFMGPEIVEFFRRIADCFMPLGWLHLDVLEVAGKPIAATFSFEFDNTFYLYNSAYEQTVARLSPGYILVSRLIEDAIERGVKQFDFLRGPQRYKYQFGARPLPLNNVRVMRKV